MSFKERLEMLIDEKGITQEQLASEINYHSPAISRMKLGKQRITDEFLSKVSDYFNVSKAFLLGESNQRTTNEINSLPLEYVLVSKEAIKKGVSAEKIKKFLEFFDSVDSD